MLQAKIKPKYFSIICIFVQVIRSFMKEKGSNDITLGYTGTARNHPYVA